MYETQSHDLVVNESKWFKDRGFFCFVCFKNIEGILGHWWVEDCHWLEGLKFSSIWVVGKGSRFVFRMTSRFKLTRVIQGTKECSMEAGKF
ncbi:hypothetical protein [Allobranchiibius sp. GilTou73]|uniref:hypothetical protein n=1 Tax=Allobranchiibius sp. GilTou73 TaxID=2904523 RepID=UPI001F1901DC|nr:hypothetical protein [Allobranchiibius sp. GilTou73]UIJ35775.1 hypothetical protein LVQ62_05160 [Allobranchiibius sp. GilTou73]